MSYEIKQYAEQLVLRALELNDTKLELARTKNLLDKHNTNPREYEVMYYTSQELKDIISDKESLIDAKKESIKLLLKQIEKEL